MAEGWARHLKGDVIEPYSAGLEPHALDVNAVKVMAEAGVDISSHRSKRLDEVRNIDFAHVITLCGHAHETCPMFPAQVNVMHVGFDDPPQLAKEAETQDEALKHYRRVRDDIKEFIETLPDSLET